MNVSKLRKHWQSPSKIWLLTSVLSKIGFKLQQNKDGITHLRYTHSNSNDESKHNNNYKNSIKHSDNDINYNYSHTCNDIDVHDMGYLKMIVETKSVAMILNKTMMSIEFIFDLIEKIIDEVNEWYGNKQYRVYFEKTFVDSHVTNASKELKSILQNHIYDPLYINENN